MNILNAVSKRLLIVVFVYQSCLVRVAFGGSNLLSCNGSIRGIDYEFRVNNQGVASIQIKDETGNRHSCPLTLFSLVDKRKQGPIPTIDFTFSSQDSCNKNSRLWLYGFVMFNVSTLRGAPVASLEALRNFGRQSCQLTTFQIAEALRVLRK
jgi:hypothetical protein